MTEAEYNHFMDHRSDPEARMVLEDFELGRGVRRARLGLAVMFDDADSADDTAADSGSGDDDAGDDSADNAAADSADNDNADDDFDSGSSVDVVFDVLDADDDAGDDSADNAAADSADNADDDFEKIKRLNNLLTKEPDMRNGLKVIQVPGRYGGWAVTRVGWLRRVNGDEWEMIGARTIVRTGSPRTLDSLAATGPENDHRLTDASLVPEEIHRLVIRRALQADVNAWIEHCPKPEGWRDE